MKIIRLCSIVSSFIIITTAYTTRQEKMPNIIYILVDDLGYGSVNLNIDKLGVFNNPALKTPNLANLADQSKVFTDHYAASPVCSPSRAGLLTGRTPTRLNIHMTGLKFVRC